MELVYPGRIAARVNAYVPNTMNPMSAPFFTSPWIRNQASVIERYAKNAYMGDWSLIPRVAYLGPMTVEMNGKSRTSNMSPKITTGGIFIVLYTGYYFLVVFLVVFLGVVFLVVFLGVVVGAPVIVGVVGEAPVGVGVLVGVGVGLDETDERAELKEQDIQKQQYSTAKIPIIVSVSIYITRQNNSSLQEDFVVGVPVIAGVVGEAPVGVGVLVDFLPFPDEADTIAELTADDIQQ